MLLATIRKGIRRDQSGRVTNLNLAGFGNPGTMVVRMTGARNMGTQTFKDRPLTRHAFAHAGPLPAPYQLAIEDTAFQMTVLDERGPRGHDSDGALMPSTWFSVELTASTKKRYLYLVQHESDTGLVVVILLFDRNTTTSDSRGLRLPPSGAWLRAMVDGPVYVLASDLVLPRKSITAWIGGREPPTIPARPPYL